MAHSYAALFIHYIFSAKNRQHLITPDIEPRVWKYLGGIARDNDMKSLAAGGTSNHIHMLVELPRTMFVAKGIQLIKTGSSNWISETFKSLNDFEWQRGYGAFTVSVSRIEPTIEYIKNQKEHHRHRTFKEEYLLFLDKHGVDYDKRYVLD
ncbi:MAG: IS200/IS605 family transposase [Candidatus Marinimicrobia bacterium]|nr:IS200/IS605 family transposase [Candidatus Neomarinimicrobiota bacterium]MCF7828099.1 IS200/IS605 family transposase [Candidatus Neomarinimicrobiota bacterium]MCF7879726.1 IS200/IS605 family transposase [Candidatus Neomarinimicrobiota bacterium]